MRAYFLRINLLLVCLLSYHLLFAQLKSNTDCNALQIPTLQDIRYRASIDVINKHLSGLLIFKMQEDSSVRTVFINEIGVTFFDISFTNTSYTIHSIMESMDKKSVKRTLAKDIGMILIRGIYSSMKNSSKQQDVIELKLKSKGRVQYHFATQCNQYPIIENFGKRRNVITITQKYLEHESMPDSIFVQHHTVHFTIRLKQMHAAE